MFKASHQIQWAHWRLKNLLLNTPMIILGKQGLPSNFEIGRGAPLVTQYWGGTRHLFLPTVYNSKNIGRGTHAPLAPLAPWFLGN